MQPVQHLHRAASVEIAEPVGIRKLKLLVTANIKMWHHPKYYKELAKKRKELERQQAAKPTSQQADEPTSEQADEPASDQASSGSRINKRSI